MASKKIGNRRPTPEGGNLTPSQKSAELIVGDIKGYLSSFEDEMANGLLAIVTGNRNKINSKQLQNKLTSKDNLFSLVQSIKDNISNISKTLNNISKTLNNMTGGNSILNSIKSANEELLKIMSESFSKDGSMNSSNNISLILDTSNADNIENILDAISNLFSESDKVTFDKFKNLEETFIYLNTLTEKNGILYNSINNINDLSSIIKESDENIKTLNLIFSGLNNIESLNKEKINEGINGLPDIFDNIQKILLEVSSIDISSDVVKIQDNLLLLKELYEKDIASTAAVINNHKDDIKTIKEGADSATEVATSASTVNESVLQDSIRNSGEIIRAIAQLGLVMILGGLIVSIYRPLINASLEFGFTLALFLTELMIPIALLTIIQKRLGVIRSMENVSQFVAISAFVMTIGGAFMLIPGLADNALLFGEVLSKFIINILLPFALLSIFLSKKIFEYIDNFANFVVKSTLIMMIGALFVLSPKLTTNSLLFGKHLAIFIGLILAPFFVYGLVKMIFVQKIIKNFSEVVLTSTLVMMIGAIFVMVGGGKYLFAALKFGLVLRWFMELIIAPFLMYSTAGIFAGWAIKNFAKLVVSCTIVMLIGAYFIKEKALWWASLKFGIVLAAFISLILLPIYVFAKKINLAAFVLRNLSILIVASVALLLIGAHLILNQPAIVLAGLAFGVVMFAFISLVLLPFMIFKRTLKTQFKTLIELSVFIIACGLTLALGAFIFNKYGEDAIYGALLMISFITSMILLVKLLNWSSKGLNKTTLKNAFTSITEICILLGTISFSIYLVAISGANMTTLKVLGIMTGIVAGLIFMIHTISKSGMTEKRVKNALGIILGISVLLIATAIALYIVKSSEADERTVAILGIMSLIVVGLIALVFLISKIKTGDVFKSVITMAGLSIVILLLSYALKVIEESNIDFETVGIVACLGLVVGEFGLILFILGKIGPGKIALGALVSLGIAVVIGALGFAVGIIKQSGIDSETLKITAILGLIVGEFAVILGIIGIPVVAGLVALGEAVALGISLVIFTLSKSLKYLHDTFNDVGVEKISKDVQSLKNLLKKDIKELLGALLSIGRVPVRPARRIKKIADNLSSAFLSMAIANKAAESIKDISIIENRLTSFVDIVSAIEDDKIKGAKKKVKKIKKIVTPLTELLGEIAKTVVDLASNKVPIKWDENGKPIEYKNLSEKEFNMAAISCKTIITTLAEGIHLAGESLKEFNWNEINKTLYTSRSLGSVISSIANGIKSYASLMIPTKWDNNGNPIWFKELTQQDFDSAKNNISNIITTLSEAIITVYKDNKELFEDKILNTGFLGVNRVLAESPFSKVLHGSMLLGRAISSVATAVASFATMQIADDWDSYGRPKHYIRLTDEQIKESGNTIKQILITLFESANKVYLDNKSMFDDVEEITGIFGIKRTEKKESNIYKVLNASKLFGDVISNLAQGIKDFALMQIADEWNENGKPKHYIPLTTNDFINASKNIGIIIIGTASAVKKAYEDNKDLFDDKKFKEIINSFVGISSMLSNMGNGIKNMASLKFDEYNEEGKVIGSVTLISDDFKKVGENISLIVSSLVEGVSTAWESFKGKASPKKIKEIMESFIPIGDLLSTLAKGISEYSQGKFSYYEDGTEKTKYLYQMSAVDIYNVGKNISSLMNAVISAVNLTYTSNKKLFDKKDLITIIQDISEANKSIAEFLEVIKKYNDIDENAITNNASKIAIIIDKNIESVVKVKDKVEVFNEIVRSMIEAGNGNLNNSEAFKQVAQGLDEINESINKIDDIKQNSFSNELNNLEEFVTQVNRVDVSKVNKLTSLMEAMANLAGSLGGFDKLVELLDGDFIDILKNLKTTVEEAKTTISTAEKIHKSRQEEFNKNVKSLEDIMKRKIMVGVGDLDNNGNIKVKNEK